MTSTTSSAPGGAPAARSAGRAPLIVGVAVALVAVAVWLWAEDLPLPAVVTLVLGAAWLSGWYRSRTGSWRVVDIVVASVLGVAGGLLFSVWNLGVYPAVSGALAFFPPLSAVVAGVWLLPGVLGGLVVRRPGAAVYTELVAAVLSALVGNTWGFSTVWYGLLEGAGAEVVLALLLYRRWGLPTALAAGAGAGVVVGVLDAFVYYPEFTTGYKLTYLAFAVLSGVVIAGLGSWALTRALAATGALAPLASGRTATRV